MRTKIIPLIVLFLLLITPNVIPHTTLYRLEARQRISKDMAVQTALSYFKTPATTHINSANLVNTPITKNKNAWKVQIDYSVPGTHILKRYTIYINSQTGEVLSDRVAEFYSEN